MVQKAGLIGIETVTHNLNRRLGEMTIASKFGLNRAVILIRASTESTPPKTPISKSYPGHVGGHLRSSWHQEFYQNAAKGLIGIVFGFTANYAAYVHEMVGGEGGAINWSRPGSGAKWFQAALGRNRKKILSIIQANASIKR